jgi:hypothetical protein
VGSGTRTWKLSTIHATMVGLPRRCSGEAAYHRIQESMSPASGWVSQRHVLVFNRNFLNFASQSSVFSAASFAFQSSPSSSSHVLLEGMYTRPDESVDIGLWYPCKYLVCALLHISIVTCERVRKGRFVVDTVRCTQTAPQHTEPQKDCDTVGNGLRSVRYTMSTHQPLHCQVALTNEPELLMAQRLLQRSEHSFETCAASTNVIHIAWRAPHANAETSMHHC